MTAQEAWEEYCREHGLSAFHPGHEAFTWGFVQGWNNCLTENLAKVATVPVDPWEAWQAALAPFRPGTKVRIKGTTVTGAVSRRHPGQRQAIEVRRLSQPERPEVTPCETGQSWYFAPHELEVIE